MCPVCQAQRAGRQKGDTCGSRMNEDGTCMCKYKMHIFFIHDKTVVHYGVLAIFYLVSMLMSNSVRI